MWSSSSSALMNDSSSANLVSLMATFFCFAILFSSSIHSALWCFYSFLYFLFQLSVAAEQILLSMCSIWLNARSWSQSRSRCSTCSRFAILYLSASVVMIDWFKLSKITLSSCCSSNDYLPTSGRFCLQIQEVLLGEPKLFPCCWNQLVPPQVWFLSSVVSSSHCLVCCAVHKTSTAWLHQAVTVDWCSWWIFWDRCDPTFSSQQPCLLKSSGNTA